MTVGSSRRTATCWPSSPTDRSRRSTGCEPVAGSAWSSAGPSPTRPDARSAWARAREFRRATGTGAGRNRRTPWPRRSSGRACGVDGIAPGDLLRAHRLERRQPGHHRADEPQRARGARLPRVQCRPGPADLLSHVGLPEGRRHRDPADAPPVHDRPGRHRPAARRRHHPQLAEPDAAPGPGRHRKRLPHPVPARHLVPGRLRARGLRRRQRERCPSTCPNRCWSASAAPSSPASPSGTWSRPSPTRPASRATSPWAPATSRNVFAGRIIEIEGLEDLTVEQAFELSDSTAERSAAGCTISLSEDSVASYLRSNLVMLRSLIDAGYEDARSLDRRARAMERWLADPSLLRRRRRCRRYAAVIEIDCVRHHRAARRLPERPRRRPAPLGGGRTPGRRGVHRIVHDQHRPLPGRGPGAGRLWPDRSRPGCGSPRRPGWTRPNCAEEGYYGTFGAVGARTELPGCSLCMGNQARVRGGLDGVLDVDPQLPQPDGPGRRRVPRIGRVGRRGGRLRLPPVARGVPPSDRR